MKYIQLLTLVMFVTHSVQAMDAERTAKKLIDYLHRNCANKAHDCMLSFVGNPLTRRADLITVETRLAQAKPKAWSWLWHAASLTVSASACATLLQATKMAKEESSISDTDYSLLLFNSAALVASLTNVIIQARDHWMQEGEFERTKLQLLARINIPDDV